MDMLTKLRVAYAKPMRVTSAYRHPTHPIEAKKPKGGTHTTGRAVDIAVDRGEAYELLGLALEIGFTGIGVQQKGNGRFLHLDNLESESGFVRPTIWSY